MIRISYHGGMVTNKKLANESMIMRLTKQEGDDCSVVLCTRDSLKLFVELGKLLSDCTKTNRSAREKQYFC